MEVTRGAGGTPSLRGRAACCPVWDVLGKTAEHPRRRASRERGAADGPERVPDSSRTTDGCPQSREHEGGGRGGGRNVPCG